MIANTYLQGLKAAELRDASWNQKHILIMDPLQSLLLKKKNLKENSHAANKT